MHRGKHQPSNFSCITFPCIHGANLVALRRRLQQWIIGMRHPAPPLVARSDRKVAAEAKFGQSTSLIRIECGLSITNKQVPKLGKSPKDANPIATI